MATLGQLSAISGQFKENLNQENKMFFLLPHKGRLFCSLHVKLYSTFYGNNPNDIKDTIGNSHDMKTTYCQIHQNHLIMIEIITFVPFTISWHGS